MLHSGIHGFGAADAVRLGLAGDRLIYLSLGDASSLAAAAGEDVAIVISAVESSHFDGTPDEGMRPGCWVCDALCRVHSALGLPGTAWIPAVD